MASLFRRTQARSCRRSAANQRFRQCILESLEGRQLLAADVTLFADSFETGSNSNDWVGNWVEDSQNDYFRSTQRATDGNLSAEVDGRASNATLMLGSPIDLSSYDSATLTFDWLIESGFDSGEYIALDVSSDGGATWTNSVRQLNGNSDPENQWQSESVDLTPYTSSNVLIRFRAQVSLSSEDANIDNVKITGQTSEPDFPPTIDYSDFSDVSDLNFVGHASTTNDNRLRLTDAGLRQGSVWHDSKQAVSTSFETQFDFVLDSTAQGLSFVIQNARPEMLGGNPGYQGVPNSLVIDFDTRMQSNQNDPNDNHVSIQSRGREHNSSHHDFSLGTAIVLPDMNDGQSHTAKIRYESGILSVFVDDMTSPALSAEVQIDELLDLELGQAWVGFTSGNNRHEVLNWQFRPLVDLSTTIGIQDAEILEGDDGTQQLVLLVQRSGPATASIQWSTVDDSAVAGDDYAAASGMIEFTDGGPDIQQISVPILSDTSEEAFEDFFVDLSITSGQATVVDDRGTGTILNDDALISIVDASAIEGATGFTFSDEFVAPAIDGLWTMSRGLDFGPDGNLYVTVEQGPYPGAVLRYDGETGEFMGAFATHNELDGAKDIEFGPDGNLYVTNNRTDKILRFNGTTGEFIDVYVPAGGDLNVPRAIVFGTDNNLYVANANSDEILRYQGPTGQNPGQLIDVFVSAGEGGMDSPTTLTFGPDGTLYVASGAHATYNNSILRFNGTTGDFIDAFDVSGTSTLALVPTAGMIFGPDLNGDGVGELYASNGDGPAEVLAFDPTSGALLEKVVESGEGGLSDPKGLAFTPEGDLLVVSSATRNILRYSGRDRAAFTVTLSSPVGQTVEVDFETVDGTAISGSDYVSTSGTITFAKGMSSQTVFVTGIDDLTQENDEEFQVLLSNAIGASFSDPQATGTILDDGDVGNQEPTADGGADQTFSDNDGTGSETVTLSGSGFDPDGSIVAYEWTDGVNVLGTTATISPSLSVGIHTLTLTVTDNEGATGSDTVVVTVDANQAPSADAGADQSAADADGSGEQVVTLIGSGSDPDGSITSYQWNDGATILGNAATISPTLSVGTHTLTFTITDNGGATSSDSVVVTITANQAPTADAGADQSIIDSDDDGSETITLSGSGSDVDGSIVAYQWTEGATVLGNTASISPSLSVGTHTLTLTVTDNGGATASDSVTVIVEAANTGPNLSHGNIASVSSTWQTVSLGQSYNSAVIVATPRYNSGSGPGVVRISNVTATSFDVRVDNAGLSAFSGGVHFIAMEEGVYDVPGEYKLEAVKVDSSVTSGKSGGWQIGSQGYQQSYSNPVVVGQVMSANDADWSVFWSSSNSRTSPANSGSLNIGKHVGEDSDTTRATETLGYFVIESTSGGTIDGLDFTAGVGNDTIRGVGNGTYQYSDVSPSGASTAVLSTAGMDGGDGGWAALIGSNPLSSTGSIALSIDEDQLRDSERNHTTEQVAYFVIGEAVGEGEAARSLATPQITVHNPLDVNGDGNTTPLDALQVINYLNASSQTEGMTLEEGDMALDANGDNQISAIDALLVINRLNANAETSAFASDSSNARAIDSYFGDLEDDEEESIFGLRLA